jgi:hypothetical protein
MKNLLFILSVLLAPAFVQAQFKLNSPSGAGTGSVSYSENPKNTK